MESTNLSKSNYVSSYDSKVMRLGQGVDIKFSQGSGTSTERVKITIEGSNMIFHSLTFAWSRGKC